MGAIAHGECADVVVMLQACSQRHLNQQFREAADPKVDVAIRIACPLPLACTPPCFLPDARTAACTYSPHLPSNSVHDLDHAEPPARAR